MISKFRGIAQRVQQALADFRLVRVHFAQLVLATDFESHSCAFASTERRLIARREPALIRQCLR